MYQQLINECFAHGPVSSEASSVSAALEANATFILATLFMYQADGWRLRSAALSLVYVHI